MITFYTIPVNSNTCQIMRFDLYLFHKTSAISETSRIKINQKDQKNMNTNTPKNEKYQASTVVKALEILKILGTRTMTASEICQVLSMNKTTAHRLLQTLQGENFIERNEETKKYRIGMKMVELCSLRLSDVEVVTEARPFLLDLVQAIQQPVHLGIYSAGNAIYVDKIDILPKINMYSQIGKTIPVHCSALGKSLLLNRTNEEITEILTQYGMQAYTPKTITEPAAYLAQIEKARKTGFTVDDNEHEENMFCLAAPLYNYRGDIIAAISSSGPQHEVLWRQDTIDRIKETARKISRRLGWNG